MAERFAGKVAIVPPERAPVLGGLLPRPFAAEGRGRRGRRLG